MTPTLPAMPFYESNVAASIKAQYRFKNDSLKNEKTQKHDISLVGGCTVVDGRLSTDRSTGRYSIPSAYFGAGDFTIEVKFILRANRATIMQILGVAHSGVLANSNNSWNLYYQNNILRFSAWPAVQVAYNTVDLGSLVVDEISHIVIERVGTTITGYVNGVSRGTMTFSAALIDSPDSAITSYNKIDPNADMFGEKTLWDIRTASRALYRGAICKNIKAFNPKSWWFGTLMAIDSTMFPNGAGTFYDNMGVQCVNANNAFAAGGAPAVVGAETFKYGKGIRMVKGAFFAAVPGQISPATLIQSWTLDFWYKDETTSADSVRPGLHPFVAYADITVNAATNRMIIGPAPGGSNPPVTYWAIWNNIANIAATSTIRHEMKGTDWQHFAIEYDSVAGATHLYKNGIRQGTIYYRLLVSQANQQVGAAALATGPISVVERYRLRTGKRFNGNFNPDEIY